MSYEETIKEKITELKKNGKATTEKEDFSDYYLNLKLEIVFCFNKRLEEKSFKISRSPKIAKIQGKRRKIYFDFNESECEIEKQCFTFSKIV